MTLFPIAVTDAEGSARESCAKIWESYGQMYSYRQVIAAEGASGVADLAIVGHDSKVRRELERLQSIGVTDMHGMLFPVPDDPDAPARTYEFLKAVASDGL